VVRIGQVQYVVRKDFGALFRTSGILNAYHQRVLQLPIVYKLLHLNLARPTTTTAIVLIAWMSTTMQSTMEIFLVSAADAPMREVRIL
jgi:hypothetical protein